MGDYVAVVIMNAAINFVDTDYLNYIGEGSQSGGYPVSDSGVPANF